VNFTPVKTSKFIKKIFPSLVWEYASNNKTLYLTFDDGPTPEITNWTLDVLKQYNAKATFFCIGKNVKAYPEIFKRIISEGHSIGNHTYSHLKGWRTKTKAYINNVNKTDAVFNELGIDTVLFRPPYGQIKRKQAKQLLQKGYEIIMWKILSVDWDKKITKEKCLTNVIDNTSPGDIIVFHDSFKASQNMQYALPKVLEHFSEKGFVFKRIPKQVQ